MEAAVFHPVHTKREAELPFYITSIGTTPVEHRIYRPDGIDSFQLLYTEKGCGIVKIDDEFIPVPEKSMMILPPNIPHYYEMQGKEWETHWITFSGWGTERLFDVDATVVHIPDNINFTEKFRKILSLRQSQEWNVQSSAILYSLLLDCKELVPEAQGSAYKLRRKLRECLKYVQNNYMKPIELSYLAELSGVSREHLCRIFRQYTGMRPFEYIMKIRLQKAKELLLLEEEMSISEIAKKTGFQSNSYFSSVFRKTVGCTAEEYRKRTI